MTRTAQRQAAEVDLGKRKPPAEMRVDPVPGPLVIDEYDATILVPPGAIARCDKWENVIIDVGGTDGRS